MIEVTKLNAPCGAEIKGVDFSKPVSKTDLKIIRQAWMDHHVLVFPNQKLENEDLVRFAEYLGPIGDDPFIEPIDGHKKIAAIHRRADETGRIFADNWHSDWSFMPVPPAGTCLYGLIIPPEGGDTFFSNQHLAYEMLPEEMKAKLHNVNAIHSARTAYARDGAYAKDNGAMRITVSDEAKKIQTHPIARNHPESGKIGLFGGSYVVDFENTPEDEAKQLAAELRDWQNRDEFVYRHKWEPDMLVLWDNRSVLHRASGGYEGYERRLHRLTIADSPDYY
ncbi:MAG: TauD/TfdA family dioxygenase [Sneathiella sp.]|nr:TauD/TfdA family dioxygenase [Sneathiella sp.]